jgi:hypothetical protein
MEYCRVLRNVVIVGEQIIESKVAEERVPMLTLQEKVVEEMEKRKTQVWGEESIYRASLGVLAVPRSRWAHSMWLAVVATGEDR